MGQPPALLLHVFHYLWLFHILHAVPSSAFQCSFDLCAFEPLFCLFLSLPWKAASSVSLPSTHLFNSEPEPNTQASPALQLLLLLFQTPDLKYFFKPPPGHLQMKDPET